MRIGALLLAAACAAWGAPEVYPPQVLLFGKGAAQTFASAEDGCQFTISDPKIAVIEDGRVVARANGATWMVTRCASGVTTVPVAVRAAGAEPKRSFLNDVAPVFTLGGCSGANCHGSIRGQRGFKLSLFGYEPEADYEAIARRINKSAPHESLILLKATGKTPHGGGVRFAAGSMEYNAILEWIRDGAAFGDTGTPRIERLRVYPGERILFGKASRMRIVAVAHYSDGTVRDMTNLVRYSANNPDVAQVDAAGRVEALETGETAIMARTMGHAAAVRVLVAGSRPEPGTARAPRLNFIDEHVFAKLEKLGVTPSALSTDAEFLRRVYLDAIGELPAEEEARAFLSSADPRKREAVIDKLLGHPRFAELWALRLTEMTRAGTREAGAKGARIMYEYFRRSFAANKPYDRLVTELLLSQGSHLFGKGPTSFYNISFDSNAADHATNISQLFLGVRLECAKCHNHPWEKWTMDDFYGFAAFFARVGIKEVYENDENATLYNEEGEVVHPKTKKRVEAKYLDGAVEPDEQDKDIRAALARWMTAPDNPFFSRTIVNRVWKYYLGRGLVEEVDDFRVTNPPTNPALLDALAKEFVRRRFDFRWLSRAILNSRTYQLSAQPNGTNGGDTINYSRYTMRRLMAETLTDVIARATGVPDKFAGYPEGTRAMQVYAGSNYMLSTFGRLNRDIICERDAQPDIVQTMHLISGDTIQKKLIAPNGVVAAWAASPRPVDELIESLFLRLLTRFPTAEEKARLAAAFAEGDRRAVLEDAFWAVMNSKEFLYNH